MAHREGFPILRFGVPYFGGVTEPTSRRFQNLREVYLHVGVLTADYGRFYAGRDIELG